MNESHATPFFKMVLIPGRGEGVVVGSDISRGTQILNEKPLFTGPNMPLTKFPKFPKMDQREKMVIRLPPTSLGRYPFSGIVKTNALPRGYGPTTGGVYPIICLSSHICFANWHSNWNQDLGLETIHAIKDIRAGEEIIINYSNGIRGATYQDSEGL